MTTRHDLNVTAERIFDGTARLAAEMIRAGRQTTWEYRQWCDEAGLCVDQGVHFADAPQPFSYLGARQCTKCGEIVDGWLLDDEPYQVCSLPGRRFGNPGLREPDEFQTTCLECGGKETFCSAIRCAECDERPCVCTTRIPL